MTKWALHYPSRSDFITDTPETPLDHAEPWITDQLAAARDAVAGILKTGVTGNESHGIQVLIGGDGHLHHEIDPAVPTEPEAVYVIVRRLTPANETAVVAGTPVPASLALETVELPPAPVP